MAFFFYIVDCLQRQNYAYGGVNHAHVTNLEYEYYRSLIVHPLGNILVLFRMTTPYIRLKGYVTGRYSG